jgi:hypothetical protein
MCHPSQMQVTPETLDMAYSTGKPMNSLPSAPESSHATSKKKSRRITSKKCVSTLSSDYLASRTVTFCNKFRTSRAQHQLNITTAQLDFKFMRLIFDFGYTNRSLRTAFRVEMLHYRVHRISVRSLTCPSEQSRISDDFRMDNLRRLGKS